MPDAGGIAGERLRAFIERIERLEEDRSGIAADIREIYAEAKSTGFDAKIMRALVRLRKLDTVEREQQAAMLDTYQRAIGM